MSLPAGVNLLSTLNLEKSQVKSSKSTPFMPVIDETALNSFVLAKHLSYQHGVCQLVGEKDQDRYDIKFGEARGGSMFNIGDDCEVFCEYAGVFDGHGSSVAAADLCSKHLYQDILSEEKKVTASRRKSHNSSLNSLSSEGRLCSIPSNEAIIEGFKNVDRRIREHSKKAQEPRTGSCAVCVFAEPLSNIIDSINNYRDISIHSEQDKNLKPEGSIKIQATSAEDKVEERKTGSVASFSSNASAAKKSLSSSGNALTLGPKPSGAGVPTDGNYSIKVAWTGDSRFVILDSAGNVIQATEDHRVETNSAEQERITQATKAGVPREGVLESQFWKQEIQNSEKTGAKLRAYSFIGQRQHPNGMYVGGKVLFSYTNGISLQVSRSLGDPFAARSAICDPEILEVKISVYQNYRVILATDGVWDVFTNKQAAKLIKGVTDPSLAARMLADKAKEKRAYQNISVDDITVVIIDIPQLIHTTGRSAKGSKLRINKVSFKDLFKLGRG